MKIPSRLVRRRSTRKGPERTPSHGVPQLSSENARLRREVERLSSALSTGQEDARTALHDRDELLRGLYEMAPHGVALADMDGRFVDFNEAFRALCGYSAEELKALDYWKLTPPEYLAQEPLQMECMLRTGRFGPYEKEYLRRDGSRVPVLINGMLIVRSDGQKFIWAIIEDITARKQVQRQMEERNTHLEQLVATRTAALQTSESFKQSILDSVAPQIAVLDRDGKILAVNQAWRRFALDNAVEPGKAELHGAVGSNYLAAIGALDASQGIQAVLEGSLPSFSLEYPCHAPDRPRWFKMNVMPLGQDASHGVTVTHSDITELFEARRDAELANHAKDAFLANMSHELRTPLNAVLGMAGLARDLATEARQREYLDKILGSGKHLNRIINDLLDLSKIAAGHMAFEIQAFGLRALLRETMSLLSQRAAEKSLELVKDVDPAVPDVLLGDPARIRQIVLNLLGNAIKFTAAGRVELHVRLLALEANRICLDIEVADTGIGMRPEDIEHLFKPFSQADASVSRQFGGTGLGLAISKRLAEMMQGDISVSSRLGHGTTFKVRLWLGVGDAASVSASAPSIEQPLPLRYRDARILVTDDQPLNLEIVEALLLAVGITPRMAENGRQALDILTEPAAAAFDLVLMDVQMPVMDGLTATRELRSRAEFKDLPIVAMTAHTMAHEIRLGTAAGMSDHIGKPFDNAHFYRTLAKWITPDKQICVQPAGVSSAPGETLCGGGKDLNTLPGVDVTAGLARFSGKEARYRHWLANFVTNSGVIPSEIRTALGTADSQTAVQVTHAFKGRVGMLGMSALHATAARLEATLREGAEPGKLLAELERSIAEMSENLTVVLALRRTHGGSRDAP